AEHRLDAVIQLIAHRLAPGVGAGVQAGGLKEAVGGQADAGDLDAGADALTGPGLLVGDLADIAGRVDVRDAVRNHPQLRLDRVHARCGDVHARVEGLPTAPAPRLIDGRIVGRALVKPCRQASRSCPAN